MPSEDTITSVSNLDIQILNAERAETTTIKLDNPKQNLTREQVSAAMQPALSNGWLLTSKGSVAMYLGDVTYNTSTKVKLGGEDFYVTPNSLTLTPESGMEFMATGTVTVSGATVQGYNIVHVSGTAPDNVEVNLSENRLTATIGFTMDDDSHLPACVYNLELVIQGTIVTVPVTVNAV